jgi:UDP-glucuronate decarboxylase
MHPQDGRVVSNFIMQALKNQDITIYGDGKQTRSFQYVDDLVTALIKYMEMDSNELKNKLVELKWNNIPVLNIGNPEEFTILELAQKIKELIPESKSNLIFKNIPMDDPKQRKPDIELAKKVLNWEPKTNLTKGLEKTIEYFRAKADYY